LSLKELDWTLEIWASFLCKKKLKLFSDNFFRDARKFIDEQGRKFHVDLSKTGIFASSDLNEPTLLELKAKGHCITSFGIGTNLVTCQAQPALGMVYKLVELNNELKIKFSEEVDKIPIPGKKDVYRLYAHMDGYPSIDILARTDEDISVGKVIYLRDLADKTVKLMIKPEKVERLLELISDGKETKKLYTLNEARDHCENQVKKIDPKILDLAKPKDYKVFITQKLYDDANVIMEENNVWKEIK